MKRIPIVILLLFSISNIFSQDWQEYNKQMIQNFQSGQLQTAISYGEKAADILKSQDSLSADYAALMNNLSYLYLQNKQYKKSISGYDKVIYIITPGLGKEHAIYLKSLCFLGEAYLYDRQYDKAEKIFLEALNTRKKTLDKKELFYIYSYVLLRKLYVEKKEYAKAKSYQDTVIQLTIDADGKYHQNHLIEIGNMADIYKDARNFEKAIALRKEVVDYYLSKNDLSDSSLGSQYILGNLYRKSGDYDKAIQVFEELAKNKKKAKGKGVNYAMALSTLGVLHFESGDYETAKSYYQQAQDLLKIKNAESTSDYAMVLHNFGVLYYEIGDFFIAAQYYEKAKSLRAKILGVEHPDYLQTINGLAVLYQESGNYKKAEPLYLQCLKVYEKYNIEDENVYTVQVNIGDLYSNTNNHLGANKYLVKAQKLGMQLYGDNSPVYAKLLKLVGNHFKDIEMYQLADSFYTQSLISIEKSIGQNNADYAGVLNNRGDLYIFSKEYKKAERDLLASSKIMKDIFGEHHYQYSTSQNNLAALYFITGQKKKSLNHIIKANEILINKINESLTYMTGQESEIFSNSTDYLFNVYYSYYYNELKENPKLTTFIYDNILAKKGLLLQSEKSLRKSVFQTRDSSLIKTYLEFIKLKEVQAKEFISDQVNSKTKNKELEKKVQKLEKQLLTNSKVFEKRKQLDIAGWKDIKKSLKKDEAAIEFLKFQYYNPFKENEIFYCAIILRADSKYPQLQFLFDENNLLYTLNKGEFYSEEEYVSNLYKKKNNRQKGKGAEQKDVANQLDSLIWQPIEKYLKGIKTIYYSPVGELHKISFSALSINDTTYVSDKYNLHALISTRSIIEHKRFTDSIDYKVSLYGGIDFDVDANEINDLTRAYKNSGDEEVENAIAGVIRNEQTRGGSWGYLKGTLEEAKIIEEIFRNQNVNVDSYLGKAAVEESFKQYTGDKTSPNIIHIATHGFFFPDDIKDNSDFFYTKKNKFQLSKNPLFRSGLLFAGANRSWNHKEMPDNVEDGILTAYEVSNTNLINTELVVLSACQTGLGEIRGSEGVYGLQRSFKIAGVEYVIMSLWQIPDKQTVELMKYFYTYKNLNFTIPQAFNKAQNEMKKRYTPYYWAGFVLIK